MSEHEAEDVGGGEETSSVEVSEPTPTAGEGLPAKVYDPHPRDNKGPGRVEDQLPEDE